MISFEAINDPEKIKGYFGVWNKLFDTGDYEASLSIEWTNALVNTHLEGSSFTLLVFKDGDEIRGLVPMCVRKVKKYGLSLSTLIPVAEYFNTHSDILLKNASEKLLESFVECLFILNNKWDVFRINRFIEGNPVLDRIRSYLERNLEIKYNIEKTEPSFYIELDNNYEEFLRKRSSNFRYKLKSVSKGIYSSGDISYRRNGDFQSFDDAYKIILSIEEKSWKHKHGTAITSSEKQRRFYKELCGSAFNNGWSRFCILYLDNEPIAFEMGLVKGMKYYGVHGSYSEKYRRLNPGTVLLAKFIEDLIQDGIKEYDWFGEPFSFQRRWTDKFRYHNALLIYNKTSKAKCFRIINTFRSRLKRNINREFALRDPRSIQPSGD